jgi:glycosyltransferase involved in cell wall biosynthesis
MNGKLSVIIITKNEAANMRDCLASVAFADEVIVLDSGSTDSTVQLCRELGAQVFEHSDWPGFGPQKNRALSYASHEWVFSIDADERVTPELQAQIVAAMSGEYDGYFVPRLSQFCGQFIHHCGWYPDYVLRLFKKSHAQFSDDLVHEHVVLNGRSAKLRSPLLHYTYLSMADVERKTLQYARAGAEKSFARGKRAHAWDAPVRGGWAFIRTYVMRAGFLDGKAGYQIALMNAKTTYLKYQLLEQIGSNKPPF